MPVNISASSIKFSSLERDPEVTMPPPKMTTDWKSVRLFPIPSIIYLIHNNVQFATLAYVDTSTYQIMGNLKIVTTGILFRCFSWSFKELQFINYFCNSNCLHLLMIEITLKEKNTIFGPYIMGSLSIWFLHFCNSQFSLYYFQLVANLISIVNSLTEIDCKLKIAEPNWLLLKLETKLRIHTNDLAAPGS